MLGPVTQIVGFKAAVAVMRQIGWLGELFTSPCIYMPFFWGCGVSDKSKTLRSRAARELQSSRNGGSKQEKADNVKRAAAYKNLSENETWLEGEKKRPSKTS